MQESPDELLVVVVVVVDVPVVELSFLQELANGAIAAKPNAANPPVKNDFLSMICSFFRSIVACLKVSKLIANG